MAIVAVILLTVVATAAAVLPPHLSPADPVAAHEGNVRRPKYAEPQVLIASVTLIIPIKFIPNPAFIYTGNEKKGVVRENS